MIYFPGDVFDLLLLGAVLFLAWTFPRTAGSQFEIRVRFSFQLLLGRDHLIEECPYWDIFCITVRTRSNMTSTFRKVTRYIE